MLELLHTERRLLVRAPEGRVFTHTHTLSPNSVLPNRQKEGEMEPSKVQIIAVAASFPGCWVSRKPRRRSSNYSI